MANYWTKLTSYDGDFGGELPYWRSLKDKLTYSIKEIQESGYEYEQKLGYRDYGHIEIPTFFPSSFKPKHLKLDPDKAAKRFINSDNNIEVDYAPNPRTTSFPRVTVNAGRGDDYLDLDAIYGQNYVANGGKGDDIIVVNRHNSIKNLRRIPRVFGGPGSDDFIINGGRVCISDYEVGKDRIDIGSYAHRRQTRVINGDLHIATIDGERIKCIVDDIDSLDQITFVNDPLA